MSDTEMLAVNAPPISQSGIITEKPVIIWGYMLKTDALYDVGIEITSADSSEVVFPMWVWPAVKKGPKHIITKGRNVKGGLRVEAHTKGHFILIPIYQNWM